MPVNKVAENVLGTIGTICWTIQVIPQIWKSWREKSTDGLAPELMFIWTISSAFLGVYSVVQNLNIPLIVQPQLFGFLSVVSWTQCMYYGKGKSLKVSMMLLIIFLVVEFGFEWGMVYAIKPAVHRGNNKPIQFFGVMSSVLLSIGLLPQYVEIWRCGEVKGISIPFMTIDLLGGVFSDLSLTFKPKFDPFAGVAYSLVVILDGVVLIAAMILNPRARRRRRRERLEESQMEEGGIIESATIENYLSDGDGNENTFVRTPSTESKHEMPVSQDVTESDEKNDVFR